MFKPKEKQPVKSKRNALTALTAAALVLPGLTAQAADEDSVDFQYSHYQEGKRDLYQSLIFSDPVAGVAGVSGVHKQAYNNPIEVDSVHGSGRFSLTDRIKFAFNYLQDTWSGATPVGTAPAILGANGYFSPEIINSGASPYGSPSLPTVYIDNKGNMYGAITSFIDSPPIIGAKNNQITHVMSYASPETRKQGDFSLSYDWDEAAVNAGGGISVENDYESRFVNLGGRMDFNQKQTTVNLGVSYTNSDTFATLDPDSLQFISTAGYDEQFFDEIDGSYRGYRPIADAPAQIESSYSSDGIRNRAVLRGKRQDWSTQLGLTQVLTPNSLLELGFGYTRSTGYLANPYKLVYFLGGTLNLGDDPNQPLAYSTGGGARLEKRPEERNQFNWNLGYNQYLPFFDAALHFDYRLSHDDWGINTHTFEADWVQPLGSGWSVTPRVRYYSQSAADFYTPFVTTLVVIDPATGVEVDSPYTRKAPKFYSSDQRLSGFGALSSGVTIAKQFARGVTLETGFEYYTHQGSLKIGGGGEQDFADYDYWVANAALKVNLDAIGQSGGASSDGESHRLHHHSATPAGVMFDHTLEKSGDFMAGYRYTRSEQAGNMLFGNTPVSSNTVNLNACGDITCAVAPDHMIMNMHMLDLMYAPTDWLSLMLMPQWMDMDMTMTQIGEFNPTGGHAAHGNTTHGHQTGGIGDTGVYALFKLLDQPGHHINLSIGGTAPTGDVNIKLRKNSVTVNGLRNVPLHYGMQLGSGTWDFKPSLTYTGEADQFSWGAQVTGTKRLESRNSANFAFGDIFQGSIWGGLQWTDWLATTVRGVYTTQGTIRGEYLPVYYPNIVPPREFKPVHVGPFDKTSNYGGRFWDLGLGININIPHGTFAGNNLKFEWLQPIYTDYNGYQLDRDYALNFTWSYGF